MSVVGVSYSDFRASGIVVICNFSDSPQTRVYSNCPAIIIGGLRLNYSLTEIGIQAGDGRSVEDPKLIIQFLPIKYYQIITKQQFPSNVSHSLVPRRREKKAGVSS